MRSYHGNLLSEFFLSAFDEEKLLIGSWKCHLSSQTHRHWCRIEGNVTSFSQYLNEFICLFKEKNKKLRRQDDCSSIVNCFRISEHGNSKLSKGKIDKPTECAEFKELPREIRDVNRVKASKDKCKLGHLWNETYFRLVCITINHSFRCTLTCEEIIFTHAER